MASSDRVAAVRATRLLETGPEEAFNRLTRLGSAILGTPMVALTVVDDVRSFLKGAPDPAVICGPDGTYESPVKDAACHLVIDAGDVVAIRDTAADARTRDLPQIHDFAAASWVGVPVQDPDGVVVGNFCAMDGVPRDWTDAEVAALRDLALAAAGEIALRLAVLAADEQAAEAAALAEVLEQSLVPTAPPEVPGVAIGTRFHAGGSGVEVMGDFYDVIPTPTGFGVVIGDVCGRGALAARATAMARAAVRTAAHSEADPVRVLGTVNEVLHAWFAGRVSFVTCAYATFTGPTTGSAWRVRVASAGHPPGFVRRAAGHVEQLDAGGLVLGLLEAAPIAAQDLELVAGDSLVLHTDGISEAHRAGDDEQLDEAGVIAALGSAAPGADADRLAEILAAAAYTQAGDTASDDAGVVVVRIAVA
ncbi:hypothetical protein GCM10023175_54960 [Pseudonocardia xishanensis]|uniref:Serine phosphatase RsbU (Regulator of sigma subunit) n=1 Tax=Pseudonocardia xishanensis TaxID=630995 RepID=A0ABP8S1E7_9PSEU